MELAEKRRVRTLFMKWLFEATGGSRRPAVDPRVFPDAIGVALDEGQLDDIIDYLEHQGLVDTSTRSMAGLDSVGLTHPGILEMEQALRAPGTPTEHFVPIVNITTVQGSIIGSQFQQGSPGAQQTGAFQNAQRDEVKRFVEEARRLVGSSALSAQDRAETNEDLDTIERELGRAQPRPSILRELAVSVKTNLINTLGAAVVTGALSIVPFP